MIIRTIVKFTLLVSLLLALAVLLFSSFNWILKKEREKQVEGLFEGLKPYPICCIEEKELEDLPLVVQRYFYFIQMPGNEICYSARLKQKGHFFNYPDTIAREFEAEQYFRGDTPAFLWMAKFGKLLRIFDRYNKGKALTEEKMFDFLSVSMQEDSCLDQGALARYFSEMLWFPSAYLYHGIEWDAIDSTSFTGLLSFGSDTVLGRFEIDQRGALLRFSTNRYMELDGEYYWEKWSIELDDYREVSGYQIPFHGKATWHLKQGDYNYLDLELIGIQYNTETSF